jgi:hypothetical protein
MTDGGAARNDCERKVIPALRRNPVERGIVRTRLQEGNSEAYLGRRDCGSCSLRSLPAMTMEAELPIRGKSFRPCAGIPSIEGWPEYVILQED